MSMDINSDYRSRLECHEEIEELKNLGHRLSANIRINESMRYLHCYGECNSCPDYNNTTEQPEF